jgi:hypothetical protein
MDLLHDSLFLFGLFIHPPVSSPFTLLLLRPSSSSLLNLSYSLFIGVDGAVATGSGLPSFVSPLSSSHPQPSRSCLFFSFSHSGLQSCRRSTVSFGVHSHPPSFCFLYFIVYCASGSLSLAHTPYLRMESSISPSLLQCCTVNRPCIFEASSDLFLSYSLPS